MARSHRFFVCSGAGCCRTKLSAVENRGYYAKIPDNQLRSSRGFQPRKVKAEFCNTFVITFHNNTTRAGRPRPYQLRADLAGAGDEPFVGHKAFESHGAAGMHFLG